MNVMWWFTEWIFFHLEEMVVFIAEQSLDELEPILSLCWKIDSSFSLWSATFQWYLNLRFWEKKIVKWSSILVFTNLCFWPDIKRKWDILQTSTTNGIYWRTFWSDSFLTFLTNSYSRRLSMDMFPICYFPISVS